MFDTIRRLFVKPPEPEPTPEAKPEVPMVEQFCVCNEDMCFCDHFVQVPDLDWPAGVRVTMNVPCADCKAGKHMWVPRRA